MAVTRELTLTPSRFGTEFAEGTSASVATDRLVRVLGVRVGAKLGIEPELDPVVSLVPNEQVDEVEEFKYHVLIVDPDGLVMVSEYIVMPNQNASLFDLVPEPVDLDAITSTELESNA